MKKTYLIALIIISTNMNINGQQAKGNIEKKDAALDAIISASAKVEIIAEGFQWSEGPLWIKKQQMLLFSDVPQNIIYKWTEKKGKEVYLTPAGYTGSTARGGETGSNGLTLDNKGRLVICQHGDRRMALMNADLQNPLPVFITLAGNYKGKRFNSPNDAIYNSKGELFFTDPPYGLEKNMDDPLKEIPFQGVYKVKITGEVVLLTDTLTRPNGLAITPNGKTLIVANSDPAKPYWYAYDFGADGTLVHPRMFFDASEAAKTDAGMPDGLKIDKQGNIFASGPGGVWIFNKDGKVLGKIKFSELTSNCALSADEKTLYVTADMYVLKVVMRK